MKVLVAEDDRISRRILEKYLRQWGYVVVCTVDGDQAWDALQNDNFHMAVLDWMMPGLSGIDLCRQIRSDPRFKHLYLLLLSGRAEKRDMIDGLEAGADDYVVKPFDPMELGSRLKVGKRLVESGILLQQKNAELASYARDMEMLAEERAQMLVHSDRLASLGVLTAGVAHEINNPSTFISGNVQTLERCWPMIQAALQKEIELNPDRRRRIELVINEFPNMMSGIRNGVKRISKIVDGLKSFARIDGNELQDFEINHCLDQAMLLCSNRFKHKTKAVMALGADIPTITGDYQKMEQVFVNLFVNAADAIEEKAHLAEKGMLRICSEFKAPYINVTVEDNGPGIPKDKLRDIWKPFFTTKAVGKGTGLGLAISHGIIQDHGGDIYVENKPEGGARFTIKLPVGV